MMVRHWIVVITPVVYTKGQGRQRCMSTQLLKWMVGGCLNGKLADELFQYKCILDEQNKVIFS